MNIMGNMVGCGSAPLKSLVIQDVDGTELFGVVTGDEIVFTATKDDVKVGKTFVSSEGIQAGEDTRTYRTLHACCCILPNEKFSIPLEKYDQYDYTKFQAVISAFNTELSDSLAVEKTVLFDGVYDVNSSNKISDVTKNTDAKSIDLNITNNSDKTFIINYNTYKEEITP